jgi:cytochrome c oxidase subunit 2
MRTFDYVIKFQEPASVLAYNIISFHHDIMFFIFIILSLVYWSLYKILKDGNCSIFNKQIGFSRLWYYSRIFIRLEQIIIFFWIRLFQWTLHLYNKLFDLISYYYVKEALTGEMDSFSKKIFLNNLGYTFYIGVYNNAYFLFNYLIVDIDKLLNDKYISYSLFTGENLGRFTYDSIDSFLSVNRFKHSTNVEYVFAAFPTIIIILLLIPSLFLLYSLDDNQAPILTYKVVGHQWYWSFEQNEIIKNMVLKTEHDLVIGQKRLLAVDTPIRLFKNIHYRFLITSSDVLHSFAVPSLGVKVDAIPGRLNQFIIEPKRTGDFYGQCSEICGTGHGFMPIHIKVLDSK